MATRSGANQPLIHPSVWAVFALLNVFWVFVLLDVLSGSSLLAVLQVLALPGYLVVIAVTIANAFTLDLASTNPALYLAILLAFYGVSVVLAVGVRWTARRLS